MRYFRYADEESPVGSGTTYIETDDGCAIRQITISGGNAIASNRPFPPWGLCLAEGQIDYDELEDLVTEIAQAEFEAVWQTHLVKHQVQWQASKRTYPIGTTVQGWIEIFFPQGVIVNLGTGTFAVADYAATRASARPEWMYPAYTVTAIVDGYDDVNQWLLLSYPQLSGERAPDSSRR